MQDAQNYERQIGAVTIMLAAMTAAVAGVGGVAYFIGPLLGHDAEMEEMLRFLLLLITAMVAIQSGVLYRMFARRLQAQPDEAARVRHWRSAVIVLAAGAEGAAVFAGVVALLTGWTWHVLPAYVVFVLVLLAVWPTRSRLAPLLAREPERRDPYR